MTDYPFPTTTGTSVSGVRSRGGTGVVPGVVSRPRPPLLCRRTMADFRPWREGTDPALRGREAQEAARGALV
jgi:hypothetical protein